MLFNLFGFHPLDYSLKDDIPGNLKGCRYCKKKYVGGFTQNSSVVLLHCPEKHTFHLSCIFEYWDRDGKYMHDCPICIFSPELNHKRVGITAGNRTALFDTMDKSFVHNVYNYEPDSFHLHSLIHDTPPITEEDKFAVYDARKSFYDIPTLRSLAGSAEPDSDDSEIYWLRENMQSLACHDGPFKWETAMSRNLFPDHREAESDMQWGWNRIVANLQRQYRDYHAARFPGAAAASQRNVIVSQSRFRNAQEAAYLRSFRRERDRRRRKRIRDAGKGLRALGQRFN